MSDEPASPGALVRAVAVGNHINLRATRSEATWVAELERIVGLAVTHLDPQRPNLLVLTEVLGLPGALVGPRGILARRPPGTGAALGLALAGLVTSRRPWLGVALAGASLGVAVARRYLPQSQVAMGLLAVGSADRMTRVMRQWGGVSPTRALLLASTDALYRPFVETLARQARRHRTHIIAGTVAPHVRRSEDPREIAAWGRAGARWAYVPTGPEVYNTALLFGPDGHLLGRTDKVFLTESDSKTLDLTAGRLEDVRVFQTAAGRIGIAISLDAFTPAYVRHLNDHGAEIVAQPDANDGPWAGYARGSGQWQPQEWLASTLGSLQPEYPNLRYNICPMQTGNLFDISFDGQSSITIRRDTPTPLPTREHTYVGVDAHHDPATGRPLLGEFLSVSPWYAKDPGIANPILDLAERRRQLMGIGRELGPDGFDAGQQLESVVYADLFAHTAR
jgi:hypothetical protein